MAFILDESQDYLWPCTIQIPKTGGGWKKIPFQARFRRLSADEIKTLSEDDDSFLAWTVIGFDKLKNYKGEPIEETDENLAELLRIPEARSALVKAFFASISGEDLRGKHGRLGN